VPGIVTLVSRRGEVHVEAVGTKAFGSSAPMGRDTICERDVFLSPATPG